MAQLQHTALQLLLQRLQHSDLELRRQLLRLELAQQFRGVVFVFVLYEVADELLAHIVIYSDQLKREGYGHYTPDRRL